MKNKILSSIIMLIVLFMITSCGNDVSIIKKGSMNFDRSVKIGNVFEAYSPFKNTEWKAFKDSQGRRIVEVNSDIDFKDLSAKDWDSLVKNSPIPELLFFTSTYAKIKDKNNPVTKEFSSITEYNHYNLSSIISLCDEITAFCSDDPAIQEVFGNMTLKERFSSWFDSNGNIIQGSFTDNNLYKPLLTAIQKNDKNAALKQVKESLKTVERFVIDPAASKAVVKFQFAINKDKSFKIIYGGIQYQIKLKGFDGFLENVENYDHVDMLQKIYAGNYLLQ